MKRKNNISNKKLLIISMLLILVVIAGAMYIGRDVFFKSNTDIAKYNTNSEKDIINQAHNENTINETLNGEIKTPTKEESTDLFRDYYEKAKKILNNMSLEEKVGQMFLVRFPESGAINEIESYYPGRICYV